MNNQPLKISIVTPSFNQGHFIAEAIESVLAQSYENFEHIIIDGGSSDNTVEVLKKYPHLIWVSEADDGQSDAINKGFKKATGDIIGWLNADDLYLPDAFECVIDKFRAERIDAIYGNYNFISCYGEITRKVYPIKPHKWVSLFNCFIPSTTFFFKREIIESGILLEVDYDITMDKEFFSNIFFSGFNIVKADAFIANFRWHENNKSINTDKVKKTTAQEGIWLLNKRFNLNIPVNGFTLYFHRKFCIFINYMSKGLYK